MSGPTIAVILLVLLAVVAAVCGVIAERRARSGEGLWDDEPGAMP